MPQDQYTSAYGETCMKCGKEERAHNRKWCQGCIDAPRQARERYLDEVARDHMQYRPTAVAAPPPVAPTGPSGVIVCGRCGHGLWQIMADERQVCAQCGERRR